MNEVLFFVELIFCFGMLVVADKLFGKYGIFGWISIASILANIQTAKQIDVFGLSATLGTIMFASIYLATDILTEKYSFEDSKRGVYIGLFSTITYLVSMQIACRYIPNDFDYVSGSMAEVFSFAPRICISSVIMFFISNFVDVHLFQKLKERKGNKLWMRNNVSTIVCNCLENFFFIFGAFLGIYSFSECILIALSTSAIEIVASLLDTPFLYFAIGKKGVKDECNS